MQPGRGGGQRHGRPVYLSFVGKGPAGRRSTDPHLAFVATANAVSYTDKIPHPWALSHDMVGYNYRLPNLNAALGCAQLEELPRFLEAKRSLAEQYRQAFADVHGIRFFVEEDAARSNYWLNTLLLDPECAAERDVLLHVTNSGGIMTRPAWTLMHRLPMYRACPRTDVAVAEELDARIINIPSSASLGGHLSQDGVAGSLASGRCLC